MIEGNLKPYFYILVLNWNYHWINKILIFVQSFLALNKKQVSQQYYLPERDTAKFSDDADRFTELSRVQSDGRLSHIVINGCDGDWSDWTRCTFNSWHSALKSFSVLHKKHWKIKRLKI